MDAKTVGTAKNPETAMTGEKIRGTLEDSCAGDGCLEFVTAEGPNTVCTSLKPNTPDLLSQMLAVSPKISDLVLSPGRPPQVELNGKLTPVSVPGFEMLTPDDTRRIATDIAGANAAVMQMLKDQGSADTSYSLPGATRFRVNIFMQRGTIAIVMRAIPVRIPTVEELKLPSVVKEIANLKNGVVLVTGPTGSGKSSTLAAIIDLINETHAYHIVTIEDPIEFMHRHKQSTIHQRELHTDTPNFALALRAALRQAPKVILVGEMRDRETIETALEAAETGHLVLSTLHTIDAAKTVERIIGAFPLDEQQVIRDRLAKSFRWIISQRLLPLKDGSGRVAIVELLKSTIRTREYMLKGDSEGKTLVDAMRDGEQEGMQDFDRELEKLVRAGLVEIDTALAYASNAGNLRLRLTDLLENTPEAKAAEEARRRQAAARAASRASVSAESFADGSQPLPEMSVSKEVTKEQEEQLADLRIIITDQLRAFSSERDFELDCTLGKTWISPQEAEAFRASYCREESFRGAFAHMLVTLTTLRARFTKERELLTLHGDSEFLWQKHADRLRFLYGKASEALTSARATLEMAGKRGLAEKVKLGQSAVQSIEVLRVEIVADLTTMTSPPSLEELLIR